jgi:hypothetical protein
MGSNPNCTNTAIRSALEQAIKDMNSKCPRICALLHVPMEELSQSGTVWINRFFHLGSSRKLKKNIPLSLYSASSIRHSNCFIDWTLIGLLIKDPVVASTLMNPSPINLVQMK